MDKIFVAKDPSLTTEKWLLHILTTGEHQPTGGVTNNIKTKITVMKNLTVRAMATGDSNRTNFHNENLINNLEMGLNCHNLTDSFKLKRIFLYNVRIIYRADIVYKFKEIRTICREICCVLNP